MARIGELGMALDEGIEAAGTGIDEYFIGTLTAVVYDYAGNKVGTLIYDTENVMRFTEETA